MNKVFSLIIVTVVLIAVLAACTAAPAATPTPAPAAAATTAPAAVEPTQAPAAAGPADIKGMKACYLIPSLSNTFLNNLATSVKRRPRRMAWKCLCMALKKVVPPRSTARSRTAFPRA